MKKLTFKQLQRVKGGFKAGAELDNGDGSSTVVVVDTDESSGSSGGGGGSSDSTVKFKAGSDLA